jgi:hypothetical protein
MTAKEPDDRFSDATAAHRALMEILEPTASGGPTATVASIETPVLQDVSAPPPSTPAGSGGAAGFFDTVKERAGHLWQQVPQQWRLPIAAGAGVLLLVGVIAAFSGSDDDGKASDEVARADGSAGAGEGKSAKGDGSGEQAGDGGEAIVIDEASGAGAEESADPEAKVLAAGLKGVDELIGEKKYDSARTALAPLIEAFPDRSELHLRMGHVMNRLKRGKDNKLMALESYRTALALDPGLAGDEGFQAEFYPLLEKPAFRHRAVEIAVELLGEAGLERLSTWVNVDKNPLPYDKRHLAIDHIRANGRDEWINEPLQTALDLWQAPTADDPCAAFDEALAQAGKDPDSFLAGTIATVPIPNVAEGEPCPDLAVKLANVQADYLVRYAGVKPQVPQAYRGRSKGR